MKIVCDACSAKYSIADEKVKGKVFKIRCKKCSNIIVVRGNAGAEDAPAPVAVAGPGGFDQKETRVYDYGGQEGAAASGAEEPVWHVVVDQEQIGPITASDVRTRFSSGQIDSETYIWREGFADWQPLNQVEDFVGLFDGGASAAEPASSGHDALANMFGTANYDDGAATRSDPNDVFAVHAAKATQPDDDDDGANDLFGAKTAGSSSPMESAAAKSAVGGGASNLKGQRGENSVLFSLNNLAALASDSPKPAPAASSASPGAAQMGGGEGSGLIDIRSMASAYHHQSPKAGSGKPGGNVGSIDDLPVFSTASFSEPAAIIPTLSGSRNNNKLLYILLAAVAALAVIAVVLVLVVLKKDPAPVVVATAPSADKAPAGSDEPPVKPATDIDKPAGGSAVAVDASVPPPVADPAADKVATNTTNPTETPATNKGTTKSDKSSDKSTKSDKSDRTSKTDRTSDKPADKPVVADKPVAEKPPSGGCMNEVECLLADKPPACCSKYGKSGGGGGSKPAPTNSNLPESLDKGAISEGVSKVKGKVEGCAGRSDAKGTVKVSVKVSAGGSVSSVTVKETPDPKLGACVSSVMQKATFAKTQNGGSFSYPFIFR